MHGGATSPGTPPHPAMEPTKATAPTRIRTAPRRVPRLPPSVRCLPTRLIPTRPWPAPSNSGSPIGRGMSAGFPAEFLQDQVPQHRRLVVRLILGAVKQAELRMLAGQLQQALQRLGTIQLLP